MSVALCGRGKQGWRKKELLFVGKKRFRKKRRRTFPSLVTFVVWRWKETGKAGIYFTLCCGHSVTAAPEPGWGISR